VTEFLALALVWFFQPAQSPVPPAVRQFTYASQVVGGTRTYRAMLPVSYSISRQRYPVVYWLHGVERDPEAREAKLMAYAAAHESILVDGGPEESKGQSPLCFPELVDQVDRTLRTVKDRAHRGVAGVASGGFVALYLARQVS
jgi:endo-1,4-beta-xylanase